MSVPARAHIDQENLVAELCELIAVRSVNPRTTDSVPVHEDGLGEVAVAQAVADLLREIPGVAVSIDEFTTGRANVVGVLDVGAERSVLLETHLDTVEPADHPSPFEPVVADGEVRGRGACDAKGQIVAQIAALRALAADPQGLGVNVVVAHVADEEHLYAGVRRLLQESWIGTVTGAIIGEPTGLEVVVSHKGVVRGEILCRGQAAHTSRPDQGVNAVELAADVVAWLRAHRHDLPVDELVGPATLAVTAAHGGDGANVVPAECRISIDRRTVPGEDAQEVWDTLGRTLRDQFGDAVDVEAPRVLDMALPRVGSGRLADALGAAVTAAGRDGSPIGVPYGTDASKIADRGIESVVFGPGLIEDAHTAHEVVREEDLVTAAAVLVAAIRRL